MSDFRRLPRYSTFASFIGAQTSTPLDQHDRLLADDEFSNDYQKERRPMFWTVVFGNSPLDRAKGIKTHTTHARAFDTRAGAEAFAISCREAGAYADVQEHIAREIKLNGANHVRERVFSGVSCRMSRLYNELGATCSIGQKHSDDPTWLL